MDLAVLLALLAGLFVLIGLAEPLALRLRLPLSVILALLGVAIGAGASFFWYSPLTDALNPLALVILTLPIGSQVFLYVLLPILLFQVALTLNLRRMADDWVPILVLAVVAVGVATAAIGAALVPVTGLPVMACLLIGAIVSTTDPSAVVGIFRATPAPQRLARIVEGESLLNDAAAIALFGVFLAFVSRGVAEPPLAEAFGRFPFLIAAGAALGLAAGRAAVAVMAWLDDQPLAQLSVSVALPFLTFLAADLAVGASGVIATVVAGMTVNLLAPGRLSPQARDKLRDTWDLLAHWAGSLIFVLAAILIPRLVPDMAARDLWRILVVAAAALAARAAVLYGLLPLLTRAGLSPRVDPPYRLAILWGGLRGAVTLALALAVTENPAVPPDIKRQVGVLATGFTLFTLLVQGTTLRWVIGRLGLDRLSPRDRALSDQVVAVALQTVREAVARTARDLGLTRSLVRDEAKRFAERLDAAVARAEAGEGIQDADRVTLGMLALAGRERDLVLDAFRDRLIPAALADRMLVDADRLIEETLARGRAGYRAAARRALRAGRAGRLAQALHNRLRWSRPLARVTADRFARLVAQGLILPRLHGFIDSRILRIHGRRVADLLHDLVNRRAEDVARELGALRLQYPGYAEELERALIRRTTLQLEDREYDELVRDGLIGPELHRALSADLAQRRAALTRLPPLDLTLQKTALVDRFPLFAGMDQTARRALTAALRTVYANPGAVILRRDDHPRSVWFIAQGAVELVQAGTRTMLGPGEMFGHVALLMRHPRRAQVTAVTPCTLLELQEAPFLAAIRHDAELARHVRDTAARRGVQIDEAALTAPPSSPRGPAARLAAALGRLGRRVARRRPAS